MGHFSWKTESTKWEQDPWHEMAPGPHLKSWIETEGGFWGANAKTSCDMLRWEHSASEKCGEVVNHRTNASFFLVHVFQRGIMQ
jgi:hypothetical protein